MSLALHGGYRLVLSSNGPLQNCLHMLSRCCCCFRFTFITDITISFHHGFRTEHKKIKKTWEIWGNWQNWGICARDGLGLGNNRAWEKAEEGGRENIRTWAEVTLVVAWVNLDMCRA